ncbi:hypothetical protein BKI52_09825 [marine bacterium AO1-C]|nr:hypothetical protein BKI52_09825 [marine bacterium AO1-C]
MNYKYLLTLSLLMLLAWTGKAQNLNTAKGVSYLTAEEQRVIYLMNVARNDGNKFIRNYLDAHVKEKGMQDNQYVKSLYRDLRRTRGLEPLKPSESLTKAADYHAQDMGKTGKIGHNSSDGTSPNKRIRKYFKGYTWGENCSYGYSDAIGIVMQLLIDDGVSSLGHRKNILKKGFKYVGVSIEPHKQYRYNCVMDFADTAQ